MIIELLHRKSDCRLTASHSTGYIYLTYNYYILLLTDAPLASIECLRSLK